MDSRNPRFGISTQLVCPHSVVPCWLSGAVPAEECWKTQSWGCQNPAVLCSALPGRQAGPFGTEAVGSASWTIHVSPEQPDLSWISLAWSGAWMRSPQEPLQPKLLCPTEQIISGNRTCCPRQLLGLCSGLLLPHGEQALLRPEREWSCSWLSKGLRFFVSTQLWKLNWRPDLLFGLCVVCWAANCTQSHSSKSYNLLLQILLIKALITLFWN